jgi:hypothetical protein
MTDTLTDAEQFFYDNAEYSWNPATETQEQGRERCARELAAAEQRMKDGPYYVTEEPDPEGIDWDNGYDGDVWVVQLWKNVDEETYGDYPLGSLGGVACDEDSPYLRVVAANLALETIPAEQKEVETQVSHEPDWKEVTDAATFGRTEHNAFPYVEIGGVKVFAFFNEFGVLVVSVDPDGANPAVQDAKGRVCVQFRGAVR